MDDCESQDIKTENKDTERSKWKSRFFHYSLIPFNFLFQVTVAFCIFILFFFYAPHQRDTLILSYVEPVIEQFSEIHFEYKDLSFKGHGDFSLKELRLYDKKGLFTTAHNMSLRLNLQSEYPHIRALSSDHIHILRQPILQKKKEDQKRNKDIFSALPAFIIGDIHLRKVTLNKPILKKTSSFSLRGRLDSVHNDYNLKISPIGGYKIAADLQGKIETKTKLSVNGGAKFPAELLTHISKRIPLQNKVSLDFKGDADLKNNITLNIEKLIIQDQNIKLKGQGSALLSHAGQIQTLDLDTEFGGGEAQISFAQKGKKINIQTDFNRFPLSPFLLENDPIAKAVLSGEMALKLGGQVPEALGDIGAIVTTNMQNAKIKDQSGTILFKPDFNKDQMSFDISAQFEKMNENAFQAHMVIDPIQSFDKNEKIKGSFSLGILPKYLPYHIQNLSPVISKNMNIKGNIGGILEAPQLTNIFLNAENIQYTNYENDLPVLQNMNVNAALDISHNALQLRHAILDGMVNNLPISIKASGQSALQKGKHDYVIDVTDYASDAETKISLSQKHRHRLMTFSSQLQSLPLSALLQPIIDIPETLLSGQLQGQFNPTMPIKSLTSDFDIMTLHHFENDHLKIAYNGEIKKSVFHSDILLSSYNTQIGNGSIIYPIDNNNVPMSVIIETELDKISSLVGQKMNEFSGILKTELSLVGDRIDGFLKLKDGAYRHKKYGTQLRNISADAVFKNREIIFRQFTANDAKNGQLSVDGTLSLNKKTPSDLSLIASDFLVLNSSDLRAKTDINLTMSGIIEKKVTGIADVTDFLFLLPDLSASAPAALNIREAIMHEEKEEQISIFDDFLKNITLDITSDIRNTAKISGFGLDGTLGGDLKIKNTAFEPQVTGMINIDRGDFELLSKEFTITQGGVFIKNNNPFFNVTATREVGDVIITATMTGTVNDPNIHFSSSPSLPDDEIISYILFDGPKTTIGPIEALRITTALAALSQGKSGAGVSTDIVGNTERALGLDKININSDDQNNVRFGAGKYLTEKLYFSVEHGGADNDTIISLRLKLKDTLVLEALLNPNARTQSENQSEIFLKYKKDY